jgi:hypothetical protein
VTEAAAASDTECPPASVPRAVAVFVTQTEVALKTRDARSVASCQPRVNGPLRSSRLA